MITITVEFKLLFQYFDQSHDFYCGNWWSQPLCVVSTKILFVLCMLAIGCLIYLVPEVTYINKMLTRWPFFIKRSSS